MPNPYFRFKQFTVYHDRCAMKVTTDACLFGAWMAEAMGKRHLATDNARALDIGTGTGLLSLMVAQKKNCRIDAVEINASAAAQAAENVAASPWKESILVVHADVMEWKPETSYNVIFSNPPFYENELRSGNTGKNIAHHDEGLKLDALFIFIKKYLKEDGSFFLLLPAKRKTEVETLLRNHNLLPERLLLVQQTTNHPPFRLMVQGCRKNDNDIKERTISIRDNNNAYTTEFIQLLQPYYLYM